MRRLFEAHGGVPSGARRVPPQPAVAASGSSPVAAAAGSSAAAAAAAGSPAYVAGSGAAVVGSSVSAGSCASAGSGAGSCAVAVGVGCSCFEDYWGEDWDSFGRGVRWEGRGVSRRGLGGGVFWFGGVSRARLGDVGVLGFCLLAVALLATALVSTVVLTGGVVEAKSARGGGGLRLKPR